MDILEDLEGGADGEVPVGFSHLIENEDILGFETVAENFFGQAIDAEGHGSAGSLQEEIACRQSLLIDRFYHLSQ